MKLSRFAAAGLLVLGAAAARADSARGVGAYPLTDRVASTWFVQTATDSSKQLALLVFLVGPAGWTKSKTNWTFDTGDPAFSDFDFQSAKLRVELARSTGRVRVADYEGSTGEANVLVIQGVGTASPHIIHKAHADLNFGAGENPPVALLRRSPELQRLLFPETPSSQRPPNKPLKLTAAGFSQLSCRARHESW